MSEILQNNQISINIASPQDAEAIIKLINKAPDALLSVSRDEILGWVDNKQSIVAKSIEGEVIGHQGMAYWPNPNMVELRAAYVDPAYRRQGLNSRMKTEMIANAKKSYPSAGIVGFTESASGSRGILNKLGFLEIDLEEVHDDFFSICPSSCIKKTGVDCGCKVYVLNHDEN